MRTTTLRQARPPPITKRALLSRHHIVAPSLCVADAAAASVFNAARSRGPIARDVIAKVTQLSIATVNRQVTALLDAGVLRERADLAVSGAIGRPRVPVEVNHEPFLTLGIHIGARTTSIVATDLFGRTLDVVETPTPRGAQAAALASLADSARRYLSRWHRRRPLWVGVAAGGVVDSTTGYLDHPRLGWTDAPVGPVLAETLGAAGVGRIARGRDGGRRAAAGPTPGVRTRRPACTCTPAKPSATRCRSAGRCIRRPAAPAPSPACPPTRICSAAPAQLESTVSDEAVLIAARKQRVIPAEGPASTMAAVLRAARQGNEQARALLAERARVLGEAVALLRDMLNPDDLVVGGQAFTEYPEGMSLVEAAYTQRSVLPARDIRVTSFGNRVQEAGAGVVSLGGIYADPIGAMRRALARRPEATA